MAGLKGCQKRILMTPDNTQAIVCLLACSPFVVCYLLSPASVWMEDKDEKISYRYQWPLVDFSLLVNCAAHRLCVVDAQQ